MKLRLSIILLAAALAAAPAAGQTIKSLGYNTTNGNIVAATNVTFTNSVGFATNARAATRTNLGGTTVGNSVFTATNAAAAASAIGLGTTNDATFSRVQVGGVVISTNSFSGGDFAVTAGYALTFISGGVASTTRTNLGLGATWLTNTDVTNFRTAIGLGATNNVTFSNIAASGTLAVTGNVTMSGVNNTATSQTASSASSLMTRELTDINPLWAVHSIRTVGAHLFGNSGTSSTAVESQTAGGAQVNSGTSTNGYGRATLYRGITTASGITGTGINFARDISFGGLVLLNPFDSTHAIRLIFGGNGGVPAPADSNALTTRGFGVEFVYSTNQVKARLFANDGTNYTTSSLTTFNHSSLAMTAFVVRSDGTGNVSLYINSSASVAPRPPADATVSISNGPTSSTGAGQYVDFVAVGNSTGTNTSGSAGFFNGYIQVK